MRKKMAILFNYAILLAVWWYFLPDFLYQLYNLLIGEELANHFLAYDAISPVQIIGSVICACWVVSKLLGIRRRHEYKL